MSLTKTTDTPNVSDWLQDEFSSRRNKNQSYSVRAFARDAGISPGRMSEFLNGRRQMSLETFFKLSQTLKSPVAVRERVVQDIMKARENTEHHLQLERDLFEIISDYQHYAILNLLKTVDFKNNVTWIAARLRLEPSLVESSISRLKRVGLLFEKNGKLRRIDKPLTTTHNIPSVALRSSHKQTLQQAIEALDVVSVESRDITSTTVAIDPKHIPYAKELIRKFRRELAELLSRGEPTEVYNINVQLHPVSFRGTEENEK